MITKKPASPEELKKLEIPVSQCLDQIEKIWLKNNTYLTSDNISIADILGACEIEQLSKYTYKFLFLFPDKLVTEAKPRAVILCFFTFLAS